MKKSVAIVLAAILTITTFLGPKATMEVQAQDNIMQMVSGMTLEQKVAQMLMPACRDITSLNTDLVALLKKYNFGGVILFANNVENPKQTTRLINSMQKANLQGGAKSALFISMDQEGGQVNRLTTGTQMPGNMALGATGNPEYAYTVASVLAEEMAVQGINLNLAPVLDVNNNPANPVIGTRSFSDDPNVVAAFGQRYVDGIHSKGVMTALKHFPGHGDTATDSHTGLPMINKSKQQLKQTELVPFGAVAKSSDFVMTAHIQYPQIEKETYVSKSGKKITLPATLSKTILTDMLRKEIGFDGVIITDSMTMDAISKNFDQMDATRLSINAGANMILIPVDLTTVGGIKNMENYIAGTVAMIQSGQISEDKVNDSVYRILKLKSKYGLMYKGKSPKAIQKSVNNAAKNVGSKAHKDIEWQVALAAVTSVKNDNVFPIAAGKKTVILYPTATQQAGIEQAIKKAGATNVTAVCTNEYTAFVESAIAGADTVICVAAMSTGENKPKNYVNYVMNTAHENGSKFIYLSSQLPYDTKEYSAADGVVACYNPTGVNVEAAIYSILGGNKMTGKMPVILF